MPYKLITDPTPITATAAAALAASRGIAWRNSDWAHVAESLGTDAPVGSPIVVNLGGGVDSTAVLLRLYQLRIRPDVIIFSWVGRDTSGDEWPETYRHMIALSGWLQEVGFPAISTINYVHAQNRYAGLYEAIFANSIYSSSNFGKHSCSAKVKAELIDRWIERDLYPEHVKAGGQVVRLIGFEAEETERANRMNRMFKVIQDDAPAKPCSKAGSFAITNHAASHWAWSFPMQVWGMTRVAAESLCLEVLGYVPSKSACYHCGFGKRADFLRLAVDHPYLASRLVDAECWVEAGGKLQIEGLGMLGQPAKGGLVRKVKPDDGREWISNGKAGKAKRWISQPRSGRVTDLYLTTGLMAAIEAARPTFRTLGLPNRTMTVHELDARADTARSLIAD